MSLNVHVQQGHYKFDGPHTSVVGLLQKSGVYVITTVVEGYHKVVDAGESSDVKSRVTGHDRAKQWEKHVADRLYVSAYYCNEQSRMLVENAIRQFHNPPCGTR